MDTVKALINIEEGVIELEGPKEFVEKYLDQYQVFIEKGFTLPSTPRRNSKEAEVGKVEKLTPKRTRTAKSKAGPTCADKIRELIEEGYFKEPKTTADISEYLLQQKGYVNAKKDVSANLKHMFDRGEIKRIREGKTFKHYINV